MMVMVTDMVRPGLASGSRTFQIICQREAPMDWAASITPKGTSKREVSVNLAMKTIAAKVKGTITAVDPMDVPTINRVKGITKTINMGNGIDRVALIIKPKTL
jgi:hypothetical protein